MEDILNQKNTFILQIDLSSHKYIFRRFNSFENLFKNFLIFFFL